jgi:hypothetical protein
MGAAMPVPPNRTNWLTLDDANEAAQDAYKEKQGRSQDTSAAAKNNKVQTTAMGDLSIEVEVSLAIFLV